jgi:hypothetical protein
MVILTGINSSWCEAQKKFIGLSVASIEFREEKKVNCLFCWGQSQFPNIFCEEPMSKRHHGLQIFQGLEVMVCIFGGICNFGTLACEV